MGENEERYVYQLIDDYLNELRRYLPEEKADDIAEELRTHMIDKATPSGSLITSTRPRWSCPSRSSW